MKKLYKALLAASLISIAGTSSTYAASDDVVSALFWVDENGLFFKEVDGSRAVNTWKWVDLDRDNVAERYYFDANGYLLTNMITPDGSYVNDEGAWVVNGVVQTKDASISRLDTDGVYPLMGMLPELHLELIHVSSEVNDSYTGTAFKEGAWGDNTTRYGASNNSFSDIDDYNWMLNHVARLSGQYEFYTYFGQNQTMENAEYEVVKSFLCSFDWKNADDVEKVTTVIKYLKEVPYDHENAQAIANGMFFESGTAYGCLVNKKAVCDGYSKAFAMLTRLMGMESARVVYGGHAFNVINIDGTWYVFDGTTLEHQVYSLMYLYQAEISIFNNVIIYDGHNTKNYIKLYV